MAFCSTCGKALEEGTVFCPYCGAKVGAPAVEPELVADPQDIADTKFLSVLAYFGAFSLITYFGVPKRSVYGRFHAKQGFTLWIASTVAEVAVGILSAMFGAISQWLTILIAPVGLAVGAAAIALTVIGIINAIKGNMKELPFIGKYKILK